MIIMKKQVFFNVLLILVAILSISFGVFFYLKLNTIETKNTVSSVIEGESKTLLSRVAELYLFPGGEEPTIATVSNPKLLKDQAFFENAQKGDNVLLFLKAGKAVLYRPSINKIIEIAPTKSNIPEENNTTQ